MAHEDFVCDKRAMPKPARKSALSRKAALANARPDSPDAIAARLALLRQVSGMSQTDFARRADISAQSWNNYEQGQNRISIDNAIRLSRVTGATLDYIFLGVEALLPAALAAMIREAQLDMDAEV